MRFAPVGDAAPPTRGPIALVGSGEFLACSDVIDTNLLERVSDRDGRAVIIPTAAGQEGPSSVGSWLSKGVDHFQRLGLEPVPLSVIDSASANDLALAEQVAGASIIYFSGGNPSYVVDTMRGSAVWAAVLSAWNEGAALAGCSAGAMMMGSVTASPRQGGVSAALGVFENLCVIPHFDRFDSSRPGMADSIVEAAGADTTVLGIDEETALIVDGEERLVLGAREVWHLTSAGRRSIRRS